MRLHESLMMIIAVFSLYLTFSDDEFQKFLPFVCFKSVISLFLVRNIKVKDKN